MAPCACSGGQQWVHLDCLRQWQRSVLLGQATHLPPESDDVRASRCSVCLEEFRVAPLSRHEVILEIVGRDFAGMLGPASIITSSLDLSRELESTLRARATAGASPRRRSIMDFVHWSRAAYLVHHIGPRQLVLAVPDEESRAAALDLVGSDDVFTLHGRRYHLWRPSVSGQLDGCAGAPAGGSLETRSVRAALSNARAPTQMRLEAEAVDCVEDTVLALNLSRPIAESDLGDASAEALRDARAISGNGEAPVRHFLGGPCDQARCVVVMRPTPGTSPADQAAIPKSFRHLPSLDAWCGTDLAAALTALQACVRPSARGAAPVPAGAQVEADAAPEQPAAKSRRVGWEEGAAGVPEPFSLLAFWGEARWSRTQLLGEAARGDWGLCLGRSSDLAELPQARFWQCLADEGRPAYVPKNEMSRSEARPSERLPQSMGPAGESPRH